MSPTVSTGKAAAPRNIPACALAFAVLVYMIAVGLQVMLEWLGWLGSRGAWLLAPLLAAAVAGAMLFGWLRCRATAKAWLVEREELLRELRETTYNITNPLNAIAAHIIALEKEYNAASVEQIAISSRRIQQAVSRLASLCSGKVAEQ